MNQRKDGWMRGEELVVEEVDVVRKEQRWGVWLMGKYWYGGGEVRWAR